MRTARPGTQRRKIVQLRASHDMVVVDYHDPETYSQNTSIIHIGRMLILASHCKIDGECMVHHFDIST